MSEEPQNCPMCGDTPLVGCDWETMDGINGGLASHVYCACGLQSPDRCGDNSGEAKRNAIAAWNRLSYKPEGWKLVPEEPNLEQLDNGDEYYLDGLGPKEIYKVMLAAAPNPQEGQE